MPTGASAALRLRLLGAVQVRSAGGEALHWPSRASAALLARLALAPQRAHPREELVELLWPGVAPDVGRNRLRQTLSTLKSLLEAEAAAGPVISADRSTLRLQPGVLACDAVEFEHQVRSGAWADALESYRGEFMPGFYDEWVLETRSHLAALHERAEAQALAQTPLPVAPMPVTTAHLLPASWTRVFGIEHSATRLLALLRHERLVTLTGPGGCGKTRLALEAARALRDAPAALPGGERGSPGAPRFARIVYVPLADCHDEAQAAAAVARVLGVSGRNPRQQIQALLTGPPALLVLDNFEQLVASAQGLVMRLLEDLPALHLLLTSRLRLGLAGEQVMVLSALPLPAVTATATADASSAALNPAVALFVDRARAVRADFHLDAAALPAVCSLVRLLDGMPLSLELAASRVGSFTPAQMLRLLVGGDKPGAHLSLLSRSGPRAGHDPRHASIAHVIDWSWQLLSADEQALLAALSEFAGDAGLPGLAAVLGEPTAAVAARMDNLVGHSLARAQPGPAGASNAATRDGRAPRFAMAEPVREFVRANWPAPALQRLQQALQAWLLEWARSLGPAPAAGAVDAELRSVFLVLARPAGGANVALELALALRDHWDSAGMSANLQTSLEAGLQALSVATSPQLLALRSDGHELLSYLRFEAGFVGEALAHADAALHDAGADPARRARALVRRAWVELAAARGEDDAGPQTIRLRGWLQEALDLSHAAGDADVKARALHQMAVVAGQVLNDWAGAEALLAESQALWQALGNRRKALARLRNRGQCWTHLGRMDEARACFELGVRSAEEEGDWVGQIDSLLSLSSLLGARRAWQEALDADRRCVVLCWRHWHRHGLAYALWNPPLALAHLRRPDDAMRLMAFAAVLWESTFGPLTRGDRQTVRRVRRLVRAQRGAARTEALWAEGAAMDIAAAVALALRA